MDYRIQNEAVMNRVRNASRELKLEGNEQRALFEKWSKAYQEWTMAKAVSNANGDLGKWYDDQRDYDLKLILHEIKPSIDSNQEKKLFEDN